VGLTRSDQPVIQSTVLSKVEELWITEPRPPRYRTVNEDVIHLEKSVTTVGGVLVDEGKQNIRALWVSYATEKRGTSAGEVFRGMHVYLIEEALESLRRGEQPQIRSIEAELWPVPLAKVRDFGLQEKWINELEQKNKRRHILIIRRTVARTDAHEKLKIW